MRFLTKVNGNFDRFLPIFANALQLAALSCFFTISPALAQIRGAALVRLPHPGVLTWGADLKFWPLDGGSPATLKKGTDFGPGGCIADVDGDGLDDLMV